MHVHRSAAHSFSRGILLLQVPFEAWRKVSAGGMNAGDADDRGNAVCSLLLTFLYPEKSAVGYLGVVEAEVRQREVQEVQELMGAEVVDLADLRVAAVDAPSHSQHF